jgi:hypothetical protein
LIDNNVKSLNLSKEYESLIDNFPSIKSKERTLEDFVSIGLSGL